MVSLLGAESIVYHQADPRRVSDYVNQHVGVHGIHGARRSDQQASLRHRSFGQLDLCSLRYGEQIQVRSKALETVYHLQLQLSGHCRWLSHGQEHYLSPGEMLVINPEDPVDLTYSSDCEKLIVKLPVDLVQQACSESQGSSPAGSIRFAASLHSAQQLPGVVELLRLICQEASSAQCQGPLVEQYGRLLAAKLLCTLETSIQRDQAGESCPSFRRIADYIEAHLKKDISVEQLAELARMSSRSLYLLFERKAGTTPKNYIRQRRLERIHQQLSRSPGSVRNITEIAMDYGFMHLGRFSESYRNEFGELPSDTLRRHH